MWQLTNSNLPTQVQTSTLMASISKLSPSTSLTSKAVISSILPKTTTNTVQSSVVAGSSGTFILNQVFTQQPLVIDTSNAGSFTIAVDPTSPQSKEFTFINGVVTLHSNIVVESATAFFTSQINTLLANGVSGLPSVPIIGDISITDSFQDHPSASMSIICRIQDINTIRSIFAVGKAFILCEFGLCVNSFNETINQFTNMVNVNIGFRGKWDRYMNAAIPLTQVSNVDYSSFQDPDCQVTSGKSSTTKTISLNTLASRIGAVVSGISFDILVPATTGASVTTTLSTEINKWIDIKQSFYRYSNPSQIQVLRLTGVSTWSFSNGDLLSAFSTTINRMPDITLSTQPQIGGGYVDYPIGNGLVPSTITTGSFFGGGENIAIISKPTIQNFITPDSFLTIAKRLNTPTQVIIHEPVKTQYTIGDQDPTFPPSQVQRLTSIDMNYDISGVIKTTVEHHDEDGFPMVEITRKYGFAYTSWNITTYMQVDPSPIQSAPQMNGNPANWWTLIEEQTKTYLYDDITGYLLGYDITGKKLTRPKLEDQSILYTQALQDQINRYSYVPEANETAEYNAQTFRWISLLGRKRYALVQHRDWYIQFANSESLIKQCNKDGTSSLIQDPNYVEPMFAIAEGEEFQSYVAADNPLNLIRNNSNVAPSSGTPPEPVYPPYTSGQETYNRTFIQILPSKNTIKTQFASASTSDFRGEDRYVTFTNNFSAQQPGFSNMAEQTSHSESTGIPPIHTRKTSQKVPETTSNTPIVANPFQYVFWTAPYTGSYPRTGSFDFEKAKSILDVQNAVVNQLQVDDIRNTLSSTCTVPLNLNIRAGDRASFNIEGMQFNRRIVGATHNIHIEGIDNFGKLVLTSTGTKLTCGIERNLNVQMKRESTSAKQTSRTFEVFSNGFTLGSLLSDTLDQTQQGTRGSWMNKLYYN